VTAAVGLPAGTGFPGGTGVTRLAVYDWTSPDGACGGTPHFHTVSAEGYVVVGGKGLVQTLTATGFQETILEPGTVAWFSPGTIHRLINDDGALDIAVVMQNAGLPEAGDAVFTFPAHVLEDPEQYRKAAALPPATSPIKVREDAARRRRDLALEGWESLRAEARAGRNEQLQALYAFAARLVADRVDGWKELWKAGPLQQALLTGEHLNALAAGDASHLNNAGVSLSRSGKDRGVGMCGRLETWKLAPAVPTSTDAHSGTGKGSVR
jgi:mannose-6-phosphate isomerase-like protein (cupin superfamily)